MKQLRIFASAENLDQVLDFVNQELKAADCPESQRVMFDIMVEEIFANITFYAYKEPPGEVEIKMEVDRDQVTISFSDQGLPYNPLEKPDPDITLSATERKVGGLGIYMVKKSMDQVTYEYQNNRNLLTLKKKIEE